MIRRAVLTDRFLHWPTRDEWLTWGERHGIDRMTPIPNVIICDDEARTITLDVFHQAPGLPRAHIYRECPAYSALRWAYRDDACTRRHTIQLESPALPFPWMPLGTTASGGEVWIAPSTPGPPTPPLSVHPGHPLPPTTDNPAS